MDIDFDYNLNDMSIVFDVGGYKGDFSHYIREKYKCPVHCFEPVFVRDLKERFKEDPLVFIYDCALSDSNTEAEIIVNNNSTSLFMGEGEKQLVKVRDIYFFIKAQALPRIDLLKLNCEGAEYPILDKLSENDWLKNVKELIIQFHGIVGKSKEDQENRLKQTHANKFKNEHWQHWKLK